MSLPSKLHIRTRSRTNQDIILLTDDIEATIGKLKADAAERKAPNDAASPGWRSPLPRSRTSASDNPSPAGVPPTPSQGRPVSETGIPRTSTESKASVSHGAIPLQAAGVPRANTESHDPLRKKGEHRKHGHCGSASSSGLPHVPRRKTDDAGSMKDEVSVAGGPDLAPGSPFSSRASSSFSVGRFSTVSDGALNRLPRFDISKFSLASAPVSPTVSAVPTPAQSQVNLPPPSPDVAEGGNSCFTFITPKRIERGVQTPIGWLVAMLCSYQSVVHERQQHLFVVRHDERMDHAQAAWKDAANRPWDPPLSDKGKVHAFQVGARLRKESVDIHRVVCSPYLRCVETAAEIVRALLASEEELAERIIDAKSVSAAAPFATQPPGGSLGFRQQIVGQMRKGKEEAQQDQQPQRPGTPRSPKSHATAASAATPTKRNKKQKKVKLRCHIEPGLCEIRSGSTSTAPAAPQNRVLLPRAQLEALLPQECLRSAGDKPLFMPPAWPEDITMGLHRLIGTGDRICEQYPNENIVIVTHSEALHASVMRCQKKANVYNIKYGAFVHLERTVYTDVEDDEDRGVSPWKLVTKSGSSGVYFNR